MAVAVSRDLTVQVLEDVNTVKLTDRQQALRAAIQRGEPKCLGVSQVMLGLMVMSYSIPLHFTEATEVVILGVPWWSGLTDCTAEPSRDLGPDRGRGKAEEGRQPGSEEEVAEDGEDVEQAEQRIFMAKGIRVELQAQTMTYELTRI